METRLSPAAPGDLEALIRMLARLPGLGPRSARRAALHLLKRRESLMQPLAALMLKVVDGIRSCSLCGNLDLVDPCHICTDRRRERSRLCIVGDVADLWALERNGLYRGQYQVLGGFLSALEGIGPEDLPLARMKARIAELGVTEVILALDVTAEAQATAHYLTDMLKPLVPEVTALAHGLPVGGELDYMDDGTLAAALSARRPFRE